MNWTTFLSQLKQSPVGDFFYKEEKLPTDRLLLIALIDIDTAIAEFKDLQTISSLGDCFASLAIFADLLGLELADIGRDIYGDEEARKVDLRRLDSHINDMKVYIGVQIKANQPLDKRKLSNLTVMLSTALIDCAYSYRFTPQKTMESVVNDN